MQQPSSTFNGSQKLRPGNVQQFVNLWWFNHCQCECPLSHVPKKSAMFYLAFSINRSINNEVQIPKVAFYTSVQNHLRYFCKSFLFSASINALRRPFSLAAAMRNAGRHSRSAQGPSLFPSSLPQACKQ